MSAIFFFFVGRSSPKQYQTIEAALCWRLNQLDIGQVFPAWAPDENVNCIGYRRISGGREYFLDGGTTEVQPRFAIDIWGTSLEEVDTKAQTIRLAISGYKGDWNGKPIANCHLTNESEQHESPLDATDNWVYRIVQEYMITTEEECNAPSFIRQAAFDSLPQSLFRFLRDNIGAAEIAPFKLDQHKEYPAILISKIDSENEDDLQDDGDAMTASYMIDVFAKSYKQAKELAIDVRLLIDGLTGTIGSTNILNIENQSEIDSVVDPVDGSNNPLYLVSCEYKIVYNQTRLEV